MGLKVNRILRRFTEINTQKINGLFTCFLQVTIEVFLNGRISFVTDVPDVR